VLGRAEGERSSLWSARRRGRPPGLYSSLSMVAFGVLLPWLAGRLLEEGIVLVAERWVLVTLMANGRDGVLFVKHGGLGKC